MPGATTITNPVVYIVDDDISVRESLQGLLAEAGMRTEVFGSAGEFLARTPDSVPSCLVLDVSLPDLNGLELQKRLVDRRGLPIIFITGHGDIPMSVQAMKGGAAEFLTKPFAPELLLDAIRAAIERSRAMLAREADHKVLRTRYDTLTAREREVMALVVRGQLNKQVAGDLDLSEITVKVHRGRMMRKMRANSLAELVNMAAQLGIAIAGEPVAAKPIPDKPVTGKQ